MNFVHIAWRIGLIFPAVLLLALPAAAEMSPFKGNPVVGLLPRDAHWSLAAVDLTTGKELISAGNAPKRLLVPGSLVKLITTGAILEQVTTNGKLDMRTTLSHDGIVHNNTLSGSLYLTGRGNAMLSAGDLRLLTRELSNRGIGKVTGDIVVDTVLVDAQGLERKQMGAAYAPAGAVGLDLHTVAITVYPATTGKPPAVVVEPFNDAVRLAVEARTVGAGADTLRITQLDDLSFSITGNIQVGSAPVRQRFPIREPALYVGGVLRTLLKEKNISLMGAVRMGRTPPKAMRLGEVESPDLDRLLHDMNVNSLNVVADNLFLLLGGERFSQPGTNEKGVKAALEFLEKLGLPMDGVRVADGSGLSAENRATANFMASYLQRVSQKSWFAQFYKALPRAGIEGTVRDIGFTDERFRIKTGSLTDSFGLAGYGVNGSNRKIAFAFLVNHPGLSGFDMKRAGAEVIKFLAKEVPL